jgi:PAS domain S-box-containing protein
MVLRKIHMTAVSGILGMLTGILVITGWFFDISAFKSVLPGIVAMKFNTALCFILSGFSLLLLNQSVQSGRGQKTAYFFSILIFVTGAITLLEYLTGWNAGIDELLWKEGPEALATSSPGRMSMVSAVNFVLLGLIFFTLSKSKFNLFKQAALFLIINLSLLVILSHSFGSSFLQSIPQLSNTALHTAFLFVLLSVGIIYSKSMQQIKYSFEKKIAGFFLLTVLVLVFIFYALDRNVSESDKTAHWVMHTNAVLQESEKIHAEAIEIQSSVRGFFITRDENYLTPFTPAVAAINSAVNELKRLTQDNPQQKSRIDSLQHLVNQSITHRQSIIDTLRAGHPDAAQKIIVQGEGKKITDHIRSIVNSIQQQEERLLDKHQAEYNGTRANSAPIITIFQILAVSLFVLSFIIIYNNTRQRNKSEAEIIASQKRFTSIFYNSPVAKCIANLEDEQYHFVNQAFCDLTGYPGEELIGKKVHDINLMGPEQRKTITQNMQRGSGRLRNIEVEIKKKDNEKTNVLFFTEMIEIDNKPCVAISLIDISERKKAEKEIKQLNETLEKRVEEKTKQVIEQETKYRFLLQNMREGIQIIGHDWRYLFVNKSVVAQSKYSYEELLGYTMMEKYPGIENTELFKILQRCITERISHTMENEFSFPDGTKEWFELSIQPVPEGLFVLSMDITERKKVESSLAESEEKFRKLVELSQDAIFINQHNKIVYVNPAALKLFAAADDGQMIGKSPFEFFHPDFHNIIKNRIQKILTEKQPTPMIEEKIINLEGKAVDVEVTGIPFIHNGEHAIQVVLRDITVRKKAEETLRKLYQAIDQTDEIVFMTDLEGTITFANPAFEEVYGYKREEIESKTTPRILKSGAQGPSFYEYLWKELKQVHSFRKEILNKTKDGRLITVDSSLSPIVDEEQRLTGFMAVQKDITERKKAEEEIRRLNETLEAKVLLRTAELEAANKELDSFSYSVSHDLRAPLRAIDGYTKVIIDDYYDKLDEEGKKTLNVIRYNSQKMGELIDDLLMFSRMGKQNIVKTTVNMNQLVQNTLEELQPAISEKIEWKINPLPDVKGDRNLLKQVLTNLLSNAVKFSSNHENPFIEIGSYSKNGQINFYVKDNGAGFDMQYYDKLFGVFQRLHSAKEFKGTGVGLAIVQRIIRRHHGKTWAEGKPGEGATFYFSIPHS